MLHGSRSMRRKAMEFVFSAGVVFHLRFARADPLNNEKWILRGDCYIHGLMSEDLFEKARVDVETIKLI